MTLNSHSLSNSEFFKIACKEVHSHFNRNQNLTGFDFESLILPLLFQNPFLSKKKEGNWIVPETFLNSPFNPNSSFVVVDIETTGGRPPQHRITELAALKVENGKISDNWVMVDFPYILKQLGTDCFNGQGWEKYDENLSHPAASDLKG